MASSILQLLYNTELMKNLELTVIMRLKKFFIKSNVIKDRNYLETL